MHQDFIRDPTGSLYSTQASSAPQHRNPAAGSYARAAASIVIHQAAERRAVATQAPQGARAYLIDLLHLARLVAVLLERRQLLAVLVLVVVLDGEAELDHAVDAAGKGGGLVEREARGEQ